MATDPNYSLTELVQGAGRDHIYHVQEQVIAAFLAAFADHSRIHVDDEYARTQGFKARVVHGAILNGFVSHFIGMIMPGHKAMVLSVDMRYHNPVYLDDVIEMHGEVTHQSPAQKVVVMEFTLKNQTQANIAAKANAKIKVRDE